MFPDLNIIPASRRGGGLKFPAPPPALCLPPPTPCLLPPASCLSPPTSCLLTLSEQEESGDLPHGARDDYKYVAPILRKDAVEKEYQKTFEDMQKLLKRMRGTLKEEEMDKQYVYLLPSVLCGIIVPAEVEEAIRLGEIENLSINKNCDKAIFKIRGRPTIFIPLKESDIGKNEGKGLWDGKGQNKETLGRQKKVLEDKKKKMFATRKIFEDLEKAADEELMNDQDRPKGKVRIFGGVSREAKQYRQKLADFREMYTPEGNMALYGDWSKSLKVVAERLDWAVLGQVPTKELEGPLPKQAKLSLVNDNQLSDSKRIKNIYDPGTLGLEVVPAVEDVVISRMDIPRELRDFVHTSRQEKSEQSCSLATMFKDEDTVRVLATLEEFLVAARKLEELGSPVGLRTGCLYDDGDGAKFTEEKTRFPVGSKVVRGVVVELEGGAVFIPGEAVLIGGQSR